MADKWRVPQRLSIDPDRVRKRTDAPTRAPINPESGRAAPQNAAAATQVPPAQEDARRAPRLRLLAFPNSGSSENVYTGWTSSWTRGQRAETGRARPSRSGPAQPPGRDARLKEAALTLCKVAKGAYDAASTFVFEDDAPWPCSPTPWAAGVRTSSLCASSNGKQPPAIMVASGFPSPSIPTEDRPWTPSRDLNDADFREECRKWRINDVVFGRCGAPTNLLRADFRCFDSIL